MVVWPTAILVLAAGVQTPSPDPLTRLNAWLSAIERHEPGTADAPARTIGAWPHSELREFAGDLAIFLDVLDDVHTITPKQRVVPRSSRPRPRGVVTAIRAMAQNFAKRNDWARLLKRGALLHADIALLVPLQQPTVSPSAVQADPRGRRGSSGRMVIQTEDGVALYFEHGTLHWDIGRMLLDSTSADPARDGMVRAWYRATAAYMLREEQFAYAVPHLSAALRVVANDPRLLFYAGAMHEAFAGPSVQAASRALESRVGARSEVESVETELELAEGFFRKTLAADPSFAEARLRLGRVLGLLGRHKEAVIELRQCLPLLPDRQLVYYAELFLGLEEAASGRRDAARAHLERAASSYPRAQSPRLSQSWLARIYGDRPAALSAVKEVFALPPDEEDRKDPWWEYYRSPVRETDALLSELRRPFLSGARER
jgi:tetratricopeptide (TPR) repeat protein